MKKKYVAPQIQAITVKDDLCGLTTASVKSSTSDTTIDNFDVHESKDPDDSEGSWYDNTDNWGGD